jgi:hypothetical protein
MSDTLLPDLVVGCDPDSTSTALAWVVREGTRYRLAGVVGGGSRAVTWQTITGARAWLAERADEVSPRVSFVVETQAVAGPHSRDVEPLRRVRYHWQAACEVDGYDYAEVDATTWQRVFAGRPGKARYQKRAKAITPLATNEDRCAALGVLWWYVSDVLGSSLEAQK